MEITGSLFLSLNFEGAEIPGRVCLLPAGKTVAGRDGRTWKNADPERAALNSMKRLSKLPIDGNRATDLAAPKGGASPAFGWITAMNAAGDGAIYGDVEWTPRGAEAVRNKEYGYISPVFLYNREGEINCILRAALTNSPNLELPALNAEQPDAKPETNDTEDSMDKALCAVLGIAETANVSDALAAIEKLKTARNADGEGGVDLQAYAPRAELNAALEKAVAAEQRLAELNAEAFKKEAAAAGEAVKAGKPAWPCAPTRRVLRSLRRLPPPVPRLWTGGLSCRKRRRPETESRLTARKRRWQKLWGIPPRSIKKSGRQGNDYNRRGITEFARDGARRVCDADGGAA
jgi:hypothetical protein